MSNSGLLFCSGGGEGIEEGGDGEIWSGELAGTGNSGGISGSCMGLGCCVLGLISDGGFGGGSTGERIGARAGIGAGEGFKGFGGGGGGEASDRAA